jgi:hypothetical protein
MPRQMTSLVREEADLHALVTLSMHDSARELRRLLSVARIAESGERRRHAVLRVWAGRAAIAMAVAAVVAVYVVMVLQLQVPMSGDPFE